MSGRTDIIAFFTPWFLNRLKEGTIDVRNPFYPKQVSRLYLNAESIEAIIFCTKNPRPILNHLHEIPYPYLFQVTITCYGKEIEPFVPSKKDVVNMVRFLSKKLGKKRVLWRYDPIFLSNKYTLDYHIHAFSKLCAWLEGYVDTCIISFLDEKKNVCKHQKELKYVSFTKENSTALALHLSRIAKAHNIHLQTCAEEYDLRHFGIQSGSCITETMLFQLTGKVKKHPKNTNRKNCYCLQTVDVGSYNTCSNRCLYCYANYEEAYISHNISQHDCHSSMLIGRVGSTDIIKVRK